MMKIAILKKANLFRGKSSYALFRGEREIGQLTGNDDTVEIALEIPGFERRACRIERTRSGIAAGAFSGMRNFLYRNATGEFRLLDSAGAVLATARQPMLFEFTISAEPLILNVPAGKGQTMARLHILNERAETIGELRRGAWKISGRSEWFSSLPDTIDPALEAFLLWLYVLCEARMENTSQPM